MRDVGIVAVSWSALLAFRMRVSMSAIGSVSTYFLLPRALGHAGDHALVGELPQADAAEPELLEHRTRAPTAVAARVRANLVAGGACGLGDHRFLGHLLLVPCLAGERHAEAAEQCPRALVVGRRRGDGDVQPPHGVDVVVVDLREDDLLADAE